MRIYATILFNVFCAAGAAVLAGVIFVPSVFAQIFITEIMYDAEGTDTGREWVEIFNAGEETIDLSTWKLFEANVNHKIVPVGSAMVASGKYAIIADVPDKFLADNSAFGGLLFDSAFSLNNEGETIAIRDTLNEDIDLVTYSFEWGAKNDGLSLQRTVDGLWVAATPTPGSATIATESEVSPVDNDNSSATTTSSGSVSGNTESSHSSQAVAVSKTDKIELEVTAGRSRLGFVGVPMDFTARVSFLKNATATVEHAWSMGDGSLRRGSVITHTYYFAGDYTVVLNSRTTGSESVSKISVKVVDPKAEIADANDSYIEIRNDDVRELNVGGLTLEHDSRKFSIALDTIILPKKSIKIPARSSGLMGIKSFVRLVDSIGTVISQWNVPKAQEVMIVIPDGLTTDDIRERFINAINSNE